jgi:hypothetical protein
MNEKIKELAEQAKIEMCSDAQLHEFAKLVVNQCINIVETHNTKCAFTTYDQSMIDCARGRFVEALKQNFKP